MFKAGDKSYFKLFMKDGDERVNLGPFNSLRGVEKFVNGKKYDEGQIEDLEIEERDDMTDEVLRTFAYLEAI